MSETFAFAGGRAGKTSGIDPVEVPVQMKRELTT